MQRSVRSHIVAIVVTLIVIIGLPQLPVMLGLGLPSWFSIFWLLLAVLVLMAHLSRARLLGKQRPLQKKKNRAKQTQI